METTILKSCLPSQKYPFPSELALLPISVRPLTPLTLSFSNLSLIWWVVPLPDWSWTKASLPTSLGGLKIHRASLHSPAAYIASVFSTQLLVSEILGYHSSHYTQLSEAFHEFSFSARHPEWSSPDAIDFPIQQCHLSKAIDQSTFDSVHSNAPSSHQKALALFSAIPHAGDWLNVVLPLH